MKFLVIPTARLNYLNIDTSTFRKSVDERNCIVHLEYIKALYPEIESDSEVISYDFNSAELKALLSGTDWSEPDGVPSEVALKASNRANILQKLSEALAINKTYLALPSPLAADRNAQVEALTKQMNKVIRLVLNEMSAND